MGPRSPRQSISIGRGRKPQSSCYLPQITGIIGFPKYLKRPRLYLMLRHNCAILQIRIPFG